MIAALSALPFVGTISSQSVAGEDSVSTSLDRLNTLIARHKAADDLYMHWADLRDEIEESGRIPPIQVQYGRLLGGLNDDGTDQWTPLYTASRAKLGDVARDQYLRGWPYTPEVGQAKADEYLARKFKELDLSRRRHNDARRRTGMVQIDREIDKAMAEIDAATIALVFHRPATESEAEVKRAYMKRSGLTPGGLGGNREFLAHLLEWFTEPLRR